MTADELKQIRKRIRFDIRSTALCLGIPHTTYQRYENGSAKVPDDIAQKMIELERFEKECDQKRELEFIEIINKQFPFGIPSEL